MSNCWNTWFYMRTCALSTISVSESATNWLHTLYLDVHCCTLLYKAERQYLLSFIVSRYCLLCLQSSTALLYFLSKWDLLQIADSQITFDIGITKTLARLCFWIGPPSWTVIQCCYNVEPISTDGYDYQLIKSHVSVQFVHYYLPFIYIQRAR